MTDFVQHDGQIATQPRPLLVQTSEMLLLLCSSPKQPRSRAAWWLLHFLTGIRTQPVNDDSSAIVQRYIATQIVSDVKLTESYRSCASADTWLLGDVTMLPVLKLLRQTDPGLSELVGW